MKQLVELTNKPKQIYDVALENSGNTFVFQLEFCEQYNSWYYAIKYNDFLLGSDFTNVDEYSPSIRLASSPNILQQYKNLIPFGISVLTDDFSDPMFLNDFSSGRVIVNLLTQDEVNTINSVLYL